MSKGAAGDASQGSWPKAPTASRREGAEGTPGTGRADRDAGAADGMAGVAPGAEEGPRLETPSPGRQGRPETREGGDSQQTGAAVGVTNGGAPLRPWRWGREWRSAVTPPRAGVGPGGTRTAAPRLRRLGPAGTHRRSGVWEGEIMAVEPSKTEILTLFKRLRAAPANKVVGRRRAPSELGRFPAAAAWARAGRRWAPGRAAAAGRPGRGLLGRGEGLRRVAGLRRGRRGGRAAAARPSLCLLSVVLRLRRQEPELGQHHLRGVPLHRLLRRAPVPGRAPQFHQVRAGGGAGPGLPLERPRGLGDGGALSRRDRRGFYVFAGRRLWVTQPSQHGVPKALQWNVDMSLLLTLQKCCLCSRP